MAHGSAYLYAVAGFKKAYRSRDGGLHWSLMPAPSTWTPSLLAAEGDELYGADGNGVHSSPNQGDLWAWASPQIPFNPVVRLAYAGGRVYIAGRDGSGLKVLEAYPTGLRGSRPGVPAQGIRLETEGGTVVFRFDLQSNGRVTWEICSASGRRAGAYASRRLAPGTYAFPWKLPGGHAGLLYRAEIRPEDPSLAPMIRMGRLAP
jgi:hypothetical protein